MKTKLLLLHFLLPLFLFAQITQIGDDIDGEAEDYSGISVSISADGSIVAIGAYGNSENGNFSGQVKVYQNTGGAWTQIGEGINGEAAEDQSGYKISLSADGSTVAIGAFRNHGNGSYSGHVRVYQNAGGTWTQIGDDIDGEAEDDRSGYSVSLNADGSTVAIGAPGNDGNGNNSGHVRVFQNTGNVWTQIGDDIDGEAEDDQSGYTVSLSTDGSTVAIGATTNDGNGNNSGHVRVYQNAGGTWTQIGDDIDGEVTNDYSSVSLSISADGNIVAIGAVHNNENGNESGHVRVYQNAGGTWTQIGEDIDGEEAYDWSGSSVSLSADGSIVAIGATENDGNGNNSGHVRVFQNTGGIWSQIGEDIDGEAADDYSGWSVSLSSDGSIVAIGAYGNDGNGAWSGHVRVFDLNVTMSIDENSILDFSVYPSPSSRLLNIESETTIVQIEIYNLLGQLVLSNTNQNTIDISSVNQGNYFIKIMNENGKIGTQKIVKK